MSIFSELLPKIDQISTVYITNFNKDLQVALQSFDRFEDEFQNQNGRRKTREKAQKDKNAMITLQSIDEGEDEPRKLSDPIESVKPSRRGTKSSSCGSRNSDPERTAPKKRSKHEVEGLNSPDQDKRPKRNASVKAQSVISKQVNVNLTQKLRRENSEKDIIEPRQSSRSRRQKDDEKENVVPNLPVHIKQEKLSLPSEPEPEAMDTECLPLDIEVKQESSKDDIAMPPPAAPVPKPRKAVPKEKAPEEPLDEEHPRRSRRATRTKKQDAPPPVATSRSTRSSSRARPEAEVEVAEVPEARPKRTRGRKKLSEIRTDSGNATQSSQESLPASPAEKPRPKRTRRAQKAEKEHPNPVKPEPEIVSSEQISSPILPIKETKSARNKKDMTHTIIELDSTKESTKSNNDKDSANTKTNEKDSANTKTNEKDSANTKTNENDSANTNMAENTVADDKISAQDKVDKILAKSKLDKQLTKEKVDKIFAKSKLDREMTNTKLVDKDLANPKINGLVKVMDKLAETQSVDQVDNLAMDETRVLTKTEMDQTMVLPNGVYNHAPVTPKNIQMNETVTLDKTVVLDKINAIMDATVVLDKGPVENKVSEDNSLLTDDESQDNILATPPQKGIPNNQPASAVKEKVQQFEEMASRVTRTKTRAMAKKEEEKDTETQTPPDKVSKVVLSSETLSKMNNLIFNGKPLQTSSSACKPRAVVPVAGKLVTSSASKASALAKWKEAADDTQTKEDARRKKEAMLEAKRELQKRKREEKMAAAAAARSAAERERRALLQAAARERAEKQHHADNEKVERLKEVERKKQELARKVLETEERRKAEEAARQQRLADEQRRAQEQRKKQIEEQEAMKREEVRMNKEIEKKHREYLEKQKKQKLDKLHTPFKVPGTPLHHHAHSQLAPAYMEDGFQYLNSDEDAEPAERPIPTWSTTKVRRQRLALQALVRQQLVDRLFSVGAHTPDLAEIFPAIERARLKRTSSAVWHTPPPPPPQPRAH